MANFTPNVNLEKPLGSEHYLIPKFNANMDKIDMELGNKVDKSEGKGLSSNDYTSSEKEKLFGIQTGANNYIHPVSHLPNIIEQDSNNRFVTDVEKNAWNSKAPIANPTFTGLITTGGQIKFPATQVPSSDPNTFDDYEEGAWTPTFSADSGSITSVQVVDARYVKIAKLVHIEVAFNITDKGTATGNLYMTIPFTSLNTSSLAGRINNTGEGLSIAVGSNSLYSYKASGVPCIDNYSYIIGGTYMTTN